MSSHATIGILVLSLLGGLPAAVPKCDLSGDIQKVQSSCREVNEALLDATQEHMGVCRNVFLLLKCVATNVTRCFDHFSNEVSMYFHSPYNCELSSSQVLELQAIHTQNTHHVTVVPLGPPTSLATPTSVTGSPHEHGKEDDKKNTVGDGTKGKANSGSKEGHTGTDHGNGAVKPVQAGVLLFFLLVMSRILAMELTS